MENRQTIQIGVIGAGHLGNFHLKQLNKIPLFSVVGLFETCKNRAIKMSQKHNVESFTNVEDLLKNADAISIVTPTPQHYEIADLGLNLDCHLFIEKPITDNIVDARLLLQKAEKLNKIIQVGHIERFNPAFSIINNKDINPQFIESHRLSEFNIRGNDVPVILDLMIHDIDLILSLVQSEIKDIQANGVKVISSTIDIANARLEFDNGCVANLTSSRISQKVMRKMRLFQEDNYLTIDFHKDIVEEYKITDSIPNVKMSDKIIEIDCENKKFISYKKPNIPQYDALKEEFIHFANSIQKSQKPKTDGYSATKALSIALEIQKLIDI